MGKASGQARLDNKALWDQVLVDNTEFEALADKAVAVDKALAVAVDNKALAVDSMVFLESRKQHMVSVLDTASGMALVLVPLGTELVCKLA